LALPNWQSWEQCILANTTLIATASQAEDSLQPGDFVFVPQYNENGTVERVAGVDASFEEGVLISASGGL